MPKLECFSKSQVISCQQWLYIFGYDAVRLSKMTGTEIVEAYNAELDKSNSDVNLKASGNYHQNV